MKKQVSEWEVPLILSLIFIMGAFLIGCEMINKKTGLENDHIAEEICEDVLEKWLDLPEDTLDFTPNSE